MITFTPPEGGDVCAEGVCGGANLRENSDQNTNLPPVWNLSKRLPWFQFFHCRRLSWRQHLNTLHFFLQCVLALLK